MRRSSFEDQPTDYAAVGATQAPDLMQYPPRGYRPYEDTIKLGSGQDRFDTASTALLSWEAQRLSGLAVTAIERGSGDHYVGVKFAEDGTPLARGDVHREERFAADGTPYITSGSSAHVNGRVGMFRIHGRVRVVYVVEEARTVGVAFGTVAGHAVSGEESFFVDFRDDDTVWFTVRSFHRPNSFIYRVMPWLLDQRRKQLTTRYLRALSPAWATEARE